MYTQKELIWLSQLSTLSDDEILKQIQEEQMQAHNYELSAFVKKLYVSHRQELKKNEELKKEKEKSPSPESETYMSN